MPGLADMPFSSAQGLFFVAFHMPRFGVDHNQDALPQLCRFLGRRVATVESGAVFTGVRQAPGHEIAGAVRGGFRQLYGGSVLAVRVTGTSERPLPIDVVLPRAGLDRAS